MFRHRSLLIFALALFVRLIHVAEISSSPFFDVPLVDGANYVRIAQLIAGGDLLGGDRVFWQPPLYPYFLALLFTLFGPGMGPVYLVQATVGALSCCVVHRIGRRLFGEREGVWAALIMAFYGPLIFFDAQPLIPVLHIVLTLAGLLFLLRAARIGDPAGEPGNVVNVRRDWGIAGLFWGLSAIATPNILFAVPIVMIWGLRRQRGVGRAVRGGGSTLVGIFLIGVALPVVAVLARNLAVAGEPVPISSNGGINFYIGNNPDYERTIRIRPGGEFERLVQEPENLGVVGAAAQSRYFSRRAVQFIAQYPKAAFRLFLRKGRDLLAGREIPRNQDTYAQRRHSTLLTLLLWRFGISFPFGVVAPLALAGAAIGWPGGRQRAGARLLLLYAAAYGASILLFFPTDRYRLPLIPIIALFAGRLLGGGAALWRM